MLDAIVTGAGGFIGRRLVRRLTAEGRSVLAVGRDRGDVAEAGFWRDLPPARVLCHLAGRSFVPDSWRDPAAFTAANVVGTQHALDWCKRHSARLVFASAYVYGVPERLPIHEDDPVRPNNPYALSKRLAEQVCQFAAAHDGIDVVALRLFNVYGPGQRADFLIPTLLRQVLEGAAIEVLDLVPRRDFVFIEDVVSAFLSAAQAPSGYHCVNIGSGDSLSVADIIAQIQAVCGTDLPVSSACAVRRNEITDVRADISRAADLLGWRPQWAFSAGIQSILEELSSDRAQRADQ